MVAAKHISPIKHIWMDRDGVWRKVIMASDCKPCDCCGEPFCPVCEDHYADCECPGPTQDGIIYKEFKKVLYGREIF